MQESNYAAYARRSVLKLDGLVWGYTSRRQSDGQVLVDTVEDTAKILRIKA